MSAISLHTKSVDELVFEHERRFFPDLSQVPFEYHKFPSVFIIQGYLNDIHKTRIRNTYDGEKTVYSQTRKTGEGISRGEHEIILSKTEYQTLFRQVEYSLRKYRYFIPYQEGVEIQLNIFKYELAGYVQIEVEFESYEAAIAFEPPLWFGIEVTHIKAHGNRSLAKRGIPKKKSL